MCILHLLPFGAWEFHTTHGLSGRQDRRFWILIAHCFYTSVLLEFDKRLSHPFYITCFIIELTKMVIQHGIRVRRSRIQVSVIHILLRVIIFDYKTQTLIHT
jgi:hypothetical protein